MPGLLLNTQVELTARIYHIFLLSVLFSNLAVLSPDAFGDMLKHFLEGAGLAKLSPLFWPIPSITDSHGPPWNLGAGPGMDLTQGLGIPGFSRRREFIEQAGDEEEVGLRG